MPAIRMVHQEHGATHAYDEGEIERLKKWGWTVEGEAPKAEEKKAEPEKRKPGRPKKAE